MQEKQENKVKEAEANEENEEWSVLEISLHFVWAARITMMMTYTQYSWLTPYSDARSHV